MKKSVFLAANTADGFVSYFDGCYDPAEDYKVYIIKGGPGSGKSSFMRYMATLAEQKGFDVIYCPCSSDPDSLDGVIIPKMKTVFLDGTSPHIVEPKIPGACEQIINTGAFWNSAKIEKAKQKIIKVWDKNKFYHKTAARYIAAAGQTYADNLKLARRFTDIKKVNAFTEKLLNKYLKINAKKPHGINCFLTCVTPKGIINQNEFICENYKTVLVIEDKYGAASSVIMKSLYSAFMLSGYTVFAAKNPILPDEITDHILIPELSLAFVTENDFIKWKTDVRRIRARRFTDKALLKASRGRLFFNRRITKALLLSAVKALAQAKKSHDELEKYYVEAMDFEKLGEYAKTLSASIFKKD